MRLLRKAHVVEILGVSEPTLDRMIRAGRFPRPLRVGKRAVAWSETEVRDWLDGLTAERDRAAGGTPDAV